MIGYYVGELDRVLILGAHDGVHLLRRSVFLKRWCSTQKRIHRARQQGILRDVAVIDFDPDEPAWRVETDGCNRPVLVIGAAVALFHCCSDPRDRTMDVQLGDLFAPRGWIAREAAVAAGALADRLDIETEAVAA